MEALRKSMEQARGVSEMTVNELLATMSGRRRSRV
jgi:hypothetical protein